MNRRTKALRLALRLTLGAAATANAHGADLVVIGNLSAAPLTKNQVADIFLGKDQTHAPVDLDESSPTRTEFYKKATGREPAQVKAAWSRLVFSGRARPPREVADAFAVKKAVVADPRAVGYIEKSAVDASVKVLSNVE